MKLRDIDVKLEEPFEQKKKKLKNLRAFIRAKSFLQLKLLTRGIGRTKLFIILKISVIRTWIFFISLIVCEL